MSTVNYNQTFSNNISLDFTIRIQILFSAGYHTDKTKIHIEVLAISVVVERKYSITGGHGRHD